MPSPMLQLSCTCVQVADKAKGRPRGLSIFMHSVYLHEHMCAALEALGGLKVLDPKLGSCGAAVSVFNC